jgi:hypothetical protein
VAVVAVDIAREQAGQVVQVAVVVKIMQVLVLGEQEQLVKAKTVVLEQTLLVAAAAAPLLLVKMFQAVVKVEPVVRVLQAQ